MDDGLRSRPRGGSNDRGRMHAWRNSVHLVFAVCGAGLAGIVARVPALRDDLGISLAEMSLLLLGLSRSGPFSDW